MSNFEVWDKRECVSHHSTAADAHRTVKQSRYASPDSGRRLTITTPAGQLVAVYIDGREQTDGIDGSAFPS